MLLHCPSSFNVSALDPGIIPAGPDAVEIVSWPPQEFCVESWRTEWFDRLDIWAVSLLKSGALDGMWDGTHVPNVKGEDITLPEPHALASQPPRRRGRLP